VVSMHSAIASGSDFCGEPALGPAALGPRSATDGAKLLSFLHTNRDTTNPLVAHREGDRGPRRIGASVSATERLALTEKVAKQNSADQQSLGAPESAKTSSRIWTRRLVSRARLCAERGSAACRRAPQYRTRLATQDRPAADWRGATDSGGAGTSNPPLVG
jgi:hypothetical protein